MSSYIFIYYIYILCIRFCHNLPAAYFLEKPHNNDKLKAFDKVAHSRFMQKVEYYGIIEKLLLWIKLFLLNRSQQVTVEGSFSSPLKVILGVPQDSVLGPNLFLIYTN